MSRATFSAVLVGHIGKVQGRYVTLEGLRDMLQDRAFGVMLFLVALITLVPIPGAGLVLGLLPAIIGLQLLVGMHRPWLPKWVLRHRMEKTKVLRGLEVLHELFGKFEAYAQPRWPWLFNPLLDRVNGAMIVIAALPILLPVPLSNLPPALALMVMALGLVEEDGVLVIASWVIIALAYLLLLALYGTLLFGMLFGALKVFG
jgi:hypothetical protein